MRKILVVGSRTSFLLWMKARPSEFKVRQIRNIARWQDALGLVSQCGDLVIALHDADPKCLGELRRRSFIVQMPT